MFFFYFVFTNKVLFVFRQTLIVQATCMGPLLPTIRTLRIWLCAKTSRAGWVMSVFCTKIKRTTTPPNILTVYIKNIIWKIKQLRHSAQCFEISQMHTYCIYNNRLQNIPLMNLKPVLHDSIEMMHYPHWDHLSSTVWGRLGIVNILFY